MPSFLDSQQDGYITEISENNTIKRVVDDSRIRYPARIAIGYDQCIVVSDWIQLSDPNGVISISSHTPWFCLIIDGYNAP
jgi:hypothetical protein